MWISPPAIFIIAAIGINIYFGYYLFVIWFRSVSSYERSHKTINRLPWWYPLKGYYLSRLENKKSWAIETKLMSIVALAFILLFDYILIMATLYGV